MSVTERALISDDLLRRLVAVGQVDLVVGVPTLNHASTIGAVARAVHTCFVRHFPRRRTVLIHSDGGSTDDTVAIVRDCVEDADTVRASPALRTSHRISTLYHPEPGLGDATRLILRAADLLQARVVVILDADLDNVTPERVAALARPVEDQGFDFVAPVYDRPPVDGLLVTQLLRPLLGSLFGRRLREPLVSEFGCSGRFAAALTDDSIVPSAALDGGAIWLVAAALSGPYKTGQVALGGRVMASGRPLPALNDIFEPIVGDVFQAVEVYADYWTTAAREDLPTIGERQPRAVREPASRPPDDGASLLATFAKDVKNLDEVLRAVIAPDSLAAIVACANEPAPQYPGPLWAATIADFLVAHHRGVMRRDHIVQALMPLYLGRAGTFLRTYGATEEDVAEAVLEDLYADFERIKNHVVDRWTTSHVR